MPEFYTFENTEHQGPRLLVLGAIHGNETCGPSAIAKIIDKFRTGELAIEKGAVTFVPVCNPEAYKRNVRYIDEDLNRVFKTTVSPKTYEGRLANWLCALVIERADILLDVHSTSAPGPTSAFIEDISPESERLVEALSVTYLIIDWSAVHLRNAYGFSSFDTERYAHDNGKEAVTIECGQHTDPDAPLRAEEAIMRALAHLGLISAEFPTPRKPQKIRMLSIEKKKSDGDVLAGPWQHLERVSAGTLIATRASGEEIRSEGEAVILLPKHHAVAGEAWYYLGAYV